MGTKQNILLIMTDQQRFDSISFHGCSAIETPNIDSLAKEGTDFTQCYVSCPLCTPSRASIFTGRSLAGHGVYKLHDILSQDQILFPYYLRKEQGYKTQLVGKLHVSGRFHERSERNPYDGFDVYEMSLDPLLDVDYPLNAYGAFLRENHPEVYRKVFKMTKGYDDHFPIDAHFSTWVGNKTCQLIEESTEDAPFFLFASFYDPHDPYFDYPIEMEQYVNGDMISIPDEPSKDMPQGALLEGRKFYKKNGEERSVSEVREIRKGYLASVKLIDIQVGAIINALKQKGIYDNTTIIFTSDHGDMLGDRKIIGKGAFFYEASEKVNMIVKFANPALNIGTCSNLVQLYDIGATILSLAGINDIMDKLPESRDLTKQIMGEIPWRDFVVTEFRNSGYNNEGRYYDPPIHATMLRTKKYKMNIYHDIIDPCNALDGELFDMENDPRQRNNLWKNTEYTATKFELSQIIMNWFVENSVRYLGTRGGEITPWTIGEKSFSMVIN